LERVQQLAEASEQQAIGLRVAKKDLLFSNGSDWVHLSFNFAWVGSRFPPRYQSTNRSPADVVVTRHVGLGFA
jgi:hypothetical protein